MHHSTYNNAPPLLMPQLYYVVWMASPYHHFHCGWCLVCFFYLFHVRSIIKYQRKWKVPGACVIMLLSRSIYQPILNNDAFTYIGQSWVYHRCSIDLGQEIPLFLPNHALHCTTSRQRGEYHHCWAGNKKILPFVCIFETFLNPFPNM